MILTIDVGNTNITCGVFEGDEIVASFRITTKMPRTSDEYGMILGNLLEQNEIKPSDIKDAIICSVVPNVMHSLQGGLIKYFHITPIVVEAGIKTGIRIVTTNPQQIGADRIADAVGAYEIYGGPLLVIDFGTATTYDLVTADGSFGVGITAPGIKISAKALWEDTAKELFLKSATYVPTENDKVDDELNKKEESKRVIIHNKKVETVKADECSKQNDKIEKECPKQK